MSSKKRSSIQSRSENTSFQSKSEKDSITYADHVISGLIRKCWKQDPTQRPKFFEIC